MRIKNIYQPIFVKNSVYFGVERKFKIENIDNKSIEMIKLLSDGIGKEDEERFKKIYGEIELSELVEMLDEHGFIEEESEEEFKANSDFVVRYKTNLNYLSNYSSLRKSSAQIQLSLNDKKILLLGVGGASILATTFMGMGFEKLTLVDFDTIELSNLNRQFIFSESQIGLPKAETAKSFLHNLNSRGEIEAISKKINGIIDIEEMIKGVDIVVNAIDSPPIESNRWVNYCCSKYKKPLFQMGMGANTVFVEKYFFGEGCYDCGLINELVNDFDDTKATMELIYGGKIKTTNTSFAPNVLAATSVLAMEVFKYVAFNENFDMTVAVDLNTLTMKKINFHEKSNVCPVCKDGKFVSIEELYRISRNDI